MFEKLKSYAARQLELDPSRLPRIPPLRAWALIPWTWWR